MIFRPLSACTAILLAAVSPIVTWPEAAVAQVTDRTPLEAGAEAAFAVLKGDKRPEEAFAPILLADVPPAQFAAISKQLESEHGALERLDQFEPVSSTAGNAVMRFEKALVTVSINIEVEAPNLINGLRIIAIEKLDDSLAKIEMDLDALPGNVSALFTKIDGAKKPVLAANQDTQYAIGSTFKLYILSALARSIENGERKWSDVVKINRQSFPSGMMQDWPEGAPVTLHTLATMMISISDNTATDLLFYALGRETVETELLVIGHSDADKTLPFLSTLQMFGLKGSENNLQKYIAADEAGQRKILADFEDDIRGNPRMVSPPQFVHPLAIDTVEWFASGRDLERLLGQLTSFSDPTALQIMAVSDVLPQNIRSDWKYAGYKGGSEPGVLNLTWLLQDKSDAWWMLSLSWNNTEENVDEVALTGLAHRILAFAN